MRTKSIVNVAEHPIQTVTVFQSRNAQVVRNISLNLRAGTNHVDIVGLSNSIDTESFRVVGLGDARLLDVVCKTNNKANEEKESPELLQARTELKRIKAEQEARKQQIDILLGYGKAMGGTTVNPVEALDFTDRLVTMRIETTNFLAKLDEKIAQLQSLIKSLSVPKVGVANARASITLVAHEDELVQLTLSYLVGNARWNPTYDLHATSTTDGRPSSSVFLHYRVHLSQSTGEHWTDAKLILSTTATDSLNVGIPEPTSLSIKRLRTSNPSNASYPAVYGTVPATVSHSLTKKRHGFRRVEEEAEEEVDFELDEDDEDFVDYIGPDPILEGISFVSKSPLAIIYTVDGATTIPSDGELHKVSVAQLSFDAKIFHVTVPRQEALAYIQCEVKNTTEYYLLPGAVSVFMDNQFVSKTSIQDVKTGDMFRCSLGVDTSTRVTYRVSSKSETSKATSFVEQYKTTTYTSVTTIHNRNTGSQPISIIEKSSVPTAPEAEKSIKVFLKQPIELTVSEDGVEVDLHRNDGFRGKWAATDTDSTGGKKAGKFVWLGDIPSGKEVVLVSEWDVRAPVEVEWTES